MCFINSAPQVPAAAATSLAPPSPTSAITQRRVQTIRRSNQGALMGQRTVLTSPLGDPGFGSSINRTVLTGAL